MDVKQLDDCDAADSSTLSDDSTSTAEIDDSISTSTLVQVADICSVVGEKDDEEELQLPITNVAIECSEFSFFSSERQEQTCKYCNKTLASVSSAKRHVSEVHLQIRNYKCSICRLSFKAKGHLLQHLQSMHQNARNVSCNLCTAKFKTKLQRYDHMRTAHPRKRKSNQGHQILIPVEKISCDICGTAFKSQVSLEKHRKKSHDGLSKYKCPSCEKSFRHRSSLYRHTKCTCLGRIREQMQTQEELQNEPWKNYDIESMGYLTGLNEQDHSTELSNPLPSDEESDSIGNAIQQEDEANGNKMVELIKEEITIIH